MGTDEDTNQEVRCSRDDVECIILRVRGRGIDVDTLTIGDILYIEQEAFHRDRIYWACSAQDSSLLPKVPPPPGTGQAKLEASVKRAKGAY